MMWAWTGPPLTVACFQPAWLHLWPSWLMCSQVPLDLWASSFWLPMYWLLHIRKTKMSQPSKGCTSSCMWPLLTRLFFPFLFTEQKYRSVRESEDVSYTSACIYVILIPHSRLTIMDPLQEANGTFALNLLKILGEDSSKNVFLSPMSISSALAMVFMGAKGTTASQMAQVSDPFHSS